MPANFIAYCQANLDYLIFVSILLGIAFLLTWTVSKLDEVWHGRIIKRAENPTGPLLWWVKTPHTWESLLLLGGNKPANQDPHPPHSSTKGNPPCH